MWHSITSHAIQALSRTPFLLFRLRIQGYDVDSHAIENTRGGAVFDDHCLIC